MKQINIYIDIQSLHNFSVRALGKHGEQFMNKIHKDLNQQTPMSFYMNNPSQENYKKIIGLIESLCSQYN